MTILLTGASGFLGRAVLVAAQNRGLKVRPIFRSIDSANGHTEAIFVKGLDGATDWSSALHGANVVIHAAAIAHTMRVDAFNPLTEYRRVNVLGTLNLARQAAASGARRFIFISSIKVLGEATVAGQPFTANDAPAPEDAYSVSKAEAEVQLKLVAQDTGMEVTIIRPPLVYGPGVKGNLSSLIGWVRRGLPLPMGDVSENLRSLVGLDNLVDLILTCTDHPNAANQTFLVSDGDDLSTIELIRKISKALGRRDCLIWVPVGLISLVASLIGKKAFSQRMLGSLQVDIERTCQLLNWKPSVSVDEGLRRAVR